MRAKCLPNINQRLIFTYSMSLPNSQRENLLGKMFMTDTLSLQNVNILGSDGMHLVGSYIDKVESCSMEVELHFNNFTTN